MAEILQFRSPNQAAAEGEQAFLGCANCQDPNIGFVPVVMQDAKGAFLVALICTQCNSEVSIEYGRLT